MEYWDHSGNVQDFWLNVKELTGISHMPMPSVRDLEIKAMGRWDISCHFIVAVVKLPPIWMRGHQQMRLLDCKVQNLTVAFLKSEKALAWLSPNIHWFSDLNNIRELYQFFNQMRKFSPLADQTKLLRVLIAHTMWRSGSEAINQLIKEFSFWLV